MKNELKSQLWDFRSQLIGEKFYFQLYAQQSRTMHFIISSICALASAGCIVSWYYTGVLNYIAGAIIFLSQLFAVFQPFLPYAKRISAANFLYQETEELALITYFKYIRLPEDCDEKEIINILEELKFQHLAINQKYASTDLFPFNEKILIKAETYAQTELGGQNEQKSIPKAKS